MLKYPRVFLALPLLIAVTAWGCSSPKLGSLLNSSPRFVAKSDPRRSQEERQCLASGAVRESAFVTPRQGLGGPKACGALRPFFMTAAAGGAVQFKPRLTVRCPMIPAVDRWVSEVVVPAAQRHLGSPVVQVGVAGSYSCRPINGRSGNRLSEHGRANAIDISSFKLAGGRRVTVKRGWNGSRGERAFLREVHQGGCRIFFTVLGPNYNKLHHDHFHLDLAFRGKNGNKRFCR